MHIIEQLPLGGGAENLLLVLAKNIDRSKFNLTFCCLRSGGYIADRLKAEGFNVFCFGNYRLRHLYKKVFDVIKLIKVEDINIVQTHLIEGNLWGRICAYLSRLPLVCKTEHSMLPEVWKNGTIKDRVRLTIDRILDRVSDCIIYVSESQMRIINQGKHYPHKHIVIHNAIDEKRFIVDKTRDSIRRLHGFSSEDVVIGIVGRLVPHKGHDYLFEAVKSVKEKHDGIKILVIGSGPEEARLKRLVKASGLDALFLSDRDDVPELMKSMDIYVQPSLRETFGITIAEAMFSGLPVVATRIGGIPEVVADGETGILIPERDSDALKNTLLRLIENPDMAKNMGERGRDVAASKFSGQRYARDMENLYISLMKKKKQRAYGH